jgi:hypothetical protein
VSVCAGSFAARRFRCRIVPPRAGLFHGIRANDERTWHRCAARGSVSERDDVRRGPGGKSSDVHAGCSGSVPPGALVHQPTDRIRLGASDCPLSA